MSILKDDHGRFWDPDCAATHAYFVEGVITTPAREARLMIMLGGTQADRARAWLGIRGLDEKLLASPAGCAQVNAMAERTHGLGSGYSHTAAVR